MKRRVADIIMDILVENGITDCFAVVGGGAMHLDNALGLNNKIHKIFNHHEQACAMAAEAYARYSGKMAAVCVTSGPGATNAITGVMGCWQDSLPMIVLSGQVRYEISVPKSGLALRYRGIQEFEIIPTVKNMTKYATMIIDPLAIKQEMHKAIQIAMEGRRGPVWLDIPLDIQSVIVEEDDMYEDEEILSAITATSCDIDFILDKLSSAKRPVILAGNGIVNSGNLTSFRYFAERLNVPVVAACIAADVMYMDYPMYYGLSGHIGPRTGNFIIQNADVILSIGCNLGFKMTGFAQDKFASKSYIISVEIDENEIKKPGVRVNKFIHSDLSSFFGIANSMVYKINVSSDWIDYCNNLMDRFSPFEAIDNFSLTDRVCAYFFWKKYAEYEPDDSITVLANNTAITAKLQIGINKPNQRIIVNNNCGSMGADLPEAIGAAVASKKEVVCVTGDGSIMMNLQELQTIRYNKLQIKIIVFSNDGYNAIRQTNKNFFNGMLVGCNKESGISFPNFRDVAKTFGFEYMICHNNGEVEECLKYFFSKKGNILLEMEECFDEIVTPKVMSRMNDDGSFSAPSLEDMYPFISKEEHDRLMLW